MGGRYKSTFTEQEVLNVIKQNPGITATRLAIRFSVSRQAMHHRLNKLIRKGFLKIDNGAGRRPNGYYTLDPTPWRRKRFHG